MSSLKWSLVFRMVCVATIGIAALLPSQEAHAFDQCGVCLGMEDCPVFLEDYDQACRRKCNPHSYAGACGATEECGPAVVCYLEM